MNPSLGIQWGYWQRIRNSALKKKKKKKRDHKTLEKDKVRKVTYIIAFYTTKTMTRFATRSFIHKFETHASKLLP